MLKSLYAAALVVATFIVPAFLPQEAKAQVVIGGPRVGVAVGRPYYGGYYNGYSNGYYNGYSNSYYSYPSYYNGYYNGYAYPAYRYGGYYPGYRYWR